MKVESVDRKGLSLRIVVENDDDLWHLSRLIEKGDRVTALTERREQSSDERLRPTREKKKKMLLTLRIEEVEFHDFSDRLRLLGIIEKGPQDIGSYHTFNVKKGSILTLFKENWTASHRKIVENAKKSGRQKPLLFVSMDMDEALVAVTRSYGIEEIAKIDSERSGKQFRGKEGEISFFQKIVDVLNTLPEDATVIITGPGFIKEGFYRYLKEKHPAIFKRSTVLSSSQAGLTGINEVLKKGGVLPKSREVIVQFEMERVEDFLAEVGRDSSLVNYGLETVRGLARQGAVEELLVCDTLLREMKKEKGEEINDLMETVEELGGKVHIISGSHEGGKLLMAFGGVAAFLRYKVEE